MLRTVRADAVNPRTDLALAALACAVFLSYMTIGFALSVIPLYVHQTLGFGNVLVGLSIGIQFLATVLTRSFAGRIADHKGASRSMRSGLMFCALSGAAYIASANLPASPAARFIALIVARLILGFGESQLIVGGLAWGIGLVGQTKAGKVMAWTGTAMYGSVAVGAPVGLWLHGLGGFSTIGAAAIILPLASLALVAGIHRVPPHPGHRKPMRSILGLIWLPGLGVALQGVGFAGIGSFVTLDFATHGWSGAGFALTCVNTHRTRTPPQNVSCPRFSWTAICPTGGSHDEVQHEQDRTQ